jgi:chemotaxis signal transduction protein
MKHTHIARHMPSVEAYRERLASLQGAWDTLSLLSHLATDSADMTNTRQAFESLSTELIERLAIETQKKAVLALKGRAQIGIDILVRNLFERTADIGFLSADEELSQFVREFGAASADDDAALQRRDVLQARLRAYVAKYSVYSDIALLAGDGRVLLRLEQGAGVVHSSDALISATLASRAAYVETFRKVDIFTKDAPSLVYSHRVDPNAVLCLCFDLEDEVQRIFAKLSSAEDWMLYAFIDEKGRVIASSDRWQLPNGAQLPMAVDENGSIIRFAGREYLAIARRTPGYQGYAGPGWLGYAMIPLEHAFAATEDGRTTAMKEEVLNDLSESEALFSAELRRIPDQARRIQEDLNRSVWNGNVRLTARRDGSNTFQKALLREVGNTGRRTQETFEHSIADLQRTVVSAGSHSAQVLASLAVDILDRNLYERANDCRWWALNATLSEHLKTGSKETAARATDVLRHINSLYTVYHSIVLFDHNGTIAAVSNPAHEHLVGQRCTESWVASTLALRDPQSFAVSSFSPSAFYDSQPTLIFGAAITSTTRTLGGIGVVFDTTPQLSAMLIDALPRDASGQVASGSVALFIDREQRVISASSHFGIGERVDLPADLLMATEAKSGVIEYRGQYYAAAICPTTGYREYLGLGAKAIVLLLLGSKPQRRTTAALTAVAHSRRAQAGESLVEIATFSCADQWLGVMRDCVVEAIDADSLRRLPGKPAWHAGVLMYGALPTPVIDLAQLTKTTSRFRRQQIIIVQPAPNRMRVGVLVDALASIIEVPATSLLSIADFSAEQANRIVDRAVQPEQPEDPVLMILNLDQLFVATKDVRAGASA